MSIHPWSRKGCMCQVILGRGLPARQATGLVVMMISQLAYCFVCMPFGAVLQVPFSELLSSSSEKVTFFLVLDISDAAKTSPAHGWHSLTNNPHLRQVHPSPSAASSLDMVQTKQYVQPHGIISYGLVMSVWAEPTTPPDAPVTANNSFSAVEVGFWSW